MMKKRVIGLIVVVVVAVGVVALIIFWPGAPAIPADHAGRTSCGCHETGAGGAPMMPQGHLDKIAKGTLTLNATDCQECHHYESSSSY